MSQDVPTPPPSKSRVFASRLLSTLVLWAVIASAIHWNSHWLIILLTGFFGIGSAFEYSRLLRTDPQWCAFNRLGLLVSLAYWLVMMIWTMRHHNVPPMWLDLAALTACVHGSFLLCYRHQLEGALTLQRIFHTLFGVVYTSVFFGFILRLMYFPSSGDSGGMPGLYLVLFLIMVTKFSDMGAYLFGVIFGRHKMIPHISPAKSWEGFGGAFVTSTAAAALLLWLVPLRLAPLDWTHGLILSPLLCLTAVTGDLAESVLKRCVAIKDSGHTLPGIGGILDLTDSLLFTAPVFYFYLAVLSA